MARRRAAPGPARGGEAVPAPRSPLARVALASAATGCALATAAYTASRAHGWGVAAVAVGCLAAALVGGSGALARPEGVAPGTFVLGALYAATLRGPVDGWSVAVAAALLLTAELAYAAVEHEPLVLVERTAALRRASALAGLVLAGAVAGLVAVGAAGVDVGAGLPLAAAGTAAAAALLLGLARLAR